MQLLAVLVFAFSAVPNASPAQQITLSASLKTGADQRPSLLLSLRNITASPLTIVTGVFADRIYPAANFALAIQLANQRRFKLERHVGSVQFFEGIILPYEIVLRPGRSFDAAHSLSDFRYFDGGQSQRIGTPATAGALLTAAIQGQQRPQAASDAWAPYWTGTASVTIPLSCGQSQK